MTKKPKVSVIVPNFNHRKYLGERIDSILSQTYDDYELILLDDCSTDGSQEFLMSYKDNRHVSHIVLNETNTGSPFPQWEKGIRLAQGEYIWIAESDDTASEEFLSMTTAQLDQHPDARLCLTGSHFIDENSNSVDALYKDDFDKWEEDRKGYVFDSFHYLKHKMIKGNSVYNASMVLFRKNGCLEDIPNEFFKMRYCGDWLFWIEQIRKGKVVELHCKLNNFRKHSASTTSKGASNGNAIEEIAKIKRMLYIQFPEAFLMILKDKSDLYYATRHLAGVPDSRKKELLESLDKEYGIRFFHYKTGRIINSISKRRHLIVFAIYLIFISVLCFLKPSSLPHMPSSWMNLPIDKIGHFLMFLPFPVLAIEAWHPEGSTKKRLGILCMIAAAGIVIAYGTELIQNLLEYRSYETADLMADLGGIVAGAIMTAIQILIRKDR